jgi:2-oxoglutarate dehydrogenase E2 component (dihydrolipoamide succinyltransferase)
VQKGELLLDVETDKVATEIVAPQDGVLSSINVSEGETVEVGTVLAVITVEGEEAETVTSEPAESAAAEQTASAKKALPERSAGNRLSPAVRRLLKQHQLDVADITGTGRDGRVTRDDVLNFVAAADSDPSGDVAERIPFDRIRRATAEHMVRSKAISPHVLQAIEADFSAVDRCRLAAREAWRAEHGFSLSYLPFVARALCLTIADFRRVNASVDGDSLLVHRSINLAIAVDLNFEGLVAPVLRDAAGLSVSELALAFNDLVQRARDGLLTADDLQGGTYTLSNPGPFGTLFTAPIINQPQVAILSLDAVAKRPVVVEGKTGDTLEIRPVGVLAHTFDHRAIDGAYSAAFLNRLRTLIEQTRWDLGKEVLPEGM